MEQQAFNSLFRDLVSRLYDRVAVETHPLAPYFPVEPALPGGRAEQIQLLIQSEIQELKPREAEGSSLTPEWRSYHILHKRYIEGADPHGIAQGLFIGDRQFRRDHSRALHALSRRIWQKYFQSPVKVPSGEAELADEAGFEFHAENLDLNEVARGVVSLIRRRMEVERIELGVDLCEAPLLVTTDRILLRQILLSLINYALHLRGQPKITLLTQAGSTYSLKILFDLDDQWASIAYDEKDSLDFACRHSRRLPAMVEESFPKDGKPGTAELRLVFINQNPRTVLVIDDQQAALQMFQRYTSRASLAVKGITDPGKALEEARTSKPAVIILDVMMPHVDGWEILQTLQLDPLTRNIPIVVCSAWGEPELARSLGAVAFLKKPVLQKDFLDILKKMGLVQELT